MKKRKSGRPSKVRVPLAPRERPHSTPKGRKKEYTRASNRRIIHRTTEEHMGKSKKRLTLESQYKVAARNLTFPQKALVEKPELSPEEAEGVRQSNLLTHARSHFLKLQGEE
ncbi:MAG: hypothetical protein A3D67_02050 [Candidatus Lloydbacteria bacterium RIFCSPHIGHO2_02_FULL_51_22]|uniref:Uncharacterized protein n=3 Tax=Candidatus Lloydiibacteriota TaxID=1817910 RepID=A0A1G2D7S1_9BACT|nr:MAG: hypothetical protein A3D67_02050 [Candidatus Lloydbacteria bacterium RIFCSPHIGHO2_02_FULL_51_22]OGZ15193.1 MAG: hypothetical protein A3J08_02980 [Candidatus Lloydbacteria bacterium RIFCSPLOWO2_02_FULL_51_11]OGZ16278.1 MAG: hypothetical protein A3G11_01100 [Candidatus Lloydbacteria bacterium RIFCSPLOWO2_12_FULL_51_9]